jgi:outer membrane receptor protein involved in Fe transport
MKIKQNLINTSIKEAMCVGLLVSMALSNIVFAQESGTEELDSMVVTGSNIKGVDLENAHPVTVIEREELLATGVTDVGDILQRLPAFTGSPIGTRTNNGGNGSVTVDLRGIGAGRTLVLINGKRTVDGGDFQTIPAVLIEKIEILKEGASAIYGADAVAGVVNIITRDDFDGAEFEIQYSDSFDTKNASNKQASVIFGEDSDSGNFTIGMQYEEQDATTQGDTPYEFLQNSYFVLDADAFASGGFNPNADYMVAVGSSRIPCGNFNLASGGPSLTVGGSSPATGDCGTPGRLLTPEDFRPYEGDIFAAENDTYNYAPVNFIQTPYKKTNIFFNGKYNFNDNVQLYGSFRYNHRTSKQRLAPVPYDTRPGGDPGYILTDGRNGISEDNVYNPFGEDIVRVRRRMVEGDREFTQDVNQYQAIFGAKGEIQDSSWTWDASYNFGFRQRVDENFGQFTGSRLANALGPSFFDVNGVATCGTPDSVIAGCVPLNLFGGTGTVTQEMLDYISATLVDHFESQLDLFNVGFNGLLFDMPAGPVGAAFGFEYRDQGAKSSPDSAKVNDLVTGNTGAGVEGSYDVSSLFTEFSIPLFDRDSSVGSLDLNTGFRYDNYSTVGSNTTFQANLVWRPTDSLLLRATFAEVFREPGVGTLFGGQSDSFPQAQDPCNTANFGNLNSEQQSICVAQGVPQGGWQQDDTQLKATVGGNPNIKPEQGETMTIGVAWSPEFLDGFTATIDWWNVNLDNGFNTLAVENVIENCLNSGSVNSSQCANVIRAPGGDIVTVLAFVQNASTIKVEGVDAEFKYAFSSDYGQFNSSLLWTHLIKRETTNFAGAPTDEFEGTFDINNSSAFNKDQGRLNLGWSKGNLSASYHIDYYSAIEAEFNFVGGIQRVPAQVYNDLTISYAIPWYESTITAGITNLFDKAPPYIDAGFNGSTDPTTYRMFGRSFFVRWKTRF